MAGKKSFESNAVFIELILSILFFSLAAAICVRIFVGANQISNRSINVGNAVIEAENFAECFKGTNGDIEEVVLMNDAEVVDGRLIMYYDADWNKCDGDLAQFVLEMSPISEGSVNYADITVKDMNDNMLFDITAALLKEVS